MFSLSQYCRKSIQSTVSRRMPSLSLDARDIFCPEMPDRPDSSLSISVLYSSR